MTPKPSSDLISISIFFFPPRTCQKLQLGLVPCLLGTLQQTHPEKQFTKCSRIPPHGTHHHEQKGPMLYVNSSKVLSFLNSDVSHNSASPGMHRCAKGCCFPFGGHSLPSEATKEEKTVAWRNEHCYMYPTCCVSALIKVRLLVEMVSFIFMPEN